MSDAEIRNYLFLLAVAIALVNGGCFDGARCGGGADEQLRAPPSKEGPGQAAEELGPSAEEALPQGYGVEQGAHRRAMEEVALDGLDFVERAGFERLGDLFVATFDDLIGLIRPREFIRPAGESYPWHEERAIMTEALDEAFRDEEQEHRQGVERFLNSAAGQEFSKARQLVGTEAQTRIAWMKLQPWLNELPPAARRDHLRSMEELAERAMMATEVPRLEMAMRVLGLAQLVEHLSEADKLQQSLGGGLLESGQALVAQSEESFAHWRAAPEEVLAPIRRRFAVLFSLIEEAAHRQEVIAFLESDDGRWLWARALLAVEVAVDEAARMRVQHIKGLVDLSRAHDLDWAQAARRLLATGHDLPCRRDDPGCFVRAIQDCRPSTHLGLPRFGGSVFAYQSVETTEVGCLIEVEILAHNDPNLAGMAMSCELPTDGDAEPAFAAIKQSVEQGQRLRGRCRGSLAERLQDANISTVTGKGPSGHHHHHH